MLLDEMGKLYLVDWDTLVLAPKERDLMFVGCGLGGRGHYLSEETRLFFEGYGRAGVDEIGMAYYRYERLVEDLVLYSWDVLNGEVSWQEQVDALGLLRRNLGPAGTLEIAFHLDRAGALQDG